MTFRLYRILVGQSLSEATAYRGTTLLIVTFGLLFYVIELLAGLVYFSFADHIYGWSLMDYFSLITSANIITYGYQTLFIAAHEELASQINEGKLDYILLRPVNSYWFNVLFRMDFPSLINLIVVVIVQVILQVKQGATVQLAILYLVTIGLGVIFVFLINQIIVTLAFWVDNLSALNGLPETLMDASARPDRIYPKVIRAIFLWGIPTLTATNLPINVIQNRFSISQLSVYVGIILVLWGASYVEWIHGVRRYASAEG